MARRWLIRIAVALVVITAAGFLFVRSLRSTRAQPYTVDGADLGGLSVELAEASGPSSPVLVLVPPPGLVRGLYDQIFKRAMESLTVPTPAAIPLVLRGEVDRAPAGAASPQVLLAAARSAGLDAAGFTPRCLAYRRASNATYTRQLYFLLFDAPAFARFRALLAAKLGGDFDPAALSPVLLVGTSASDGAEWLPLRADAARDCVAPIAIGRAPG
jgi:hypothetical protein